jgi:glycosyltransferase involved in cell wall biosynthesis
MKVLILPDNFPPEVNAQSRRIFEHAKRWVEKDVDVKVITCAPNFPQGKVYPGYRNRFYQKETIAGIDVVRVWSYIAPNAGFTRRILDQVSFGVTCFIAGLFCRADLFIASTPNFFPAFSACFLSILKRRPWIFEIRDLWTDSIIAVGVMKRNFLIRTLARMEQRLYRHANRIIVVSPAFKNQLIQEGVDGEKIDVITNGVDRHEYLPRERDADLETRFDLRGKFVFGYVGTHGMAHGLDLVLQWATKVHDPKIHFMFIGDGAEKAALVDLVARLGLKNISLLDSVPHEEVTRYLSLLDVALVPLRKTETFLGVIPSKIFEAASMHKPILLGVDGVTRSIVEEYDAGIFFEPENEVAFLEAVYRMASDPVLLSRLKGGCEKLANAYDRITLADKMLEILRSVARS